MQRSGDSTARLWRLGEGGVSGHTSSVVLPHEPVDSSSQQEINRDVTTVHWNVRDTGHYNTILFVYCCLVNLGLPDKDMEG